MELHIDTFGEMNHVNYEGNLYNQTFTDEVQTSIKDIFANQGNQTEVEFKRFHAYKIDCTSAGGNASFTYQYTFFRPLSKNEIEEICIARINWQNGATNLSTDTVNLLLKETRHLTMPLKMKFDREASISSALSADNSGHQLATAKTFVISLDRKPERYEFVKRQLDNLGIEHEKFVAVDGYNVTVAKFDKSWTGWDFSQNGEEIKKYITYKVNCLPEVAVGADAEAMASVFSVLKIFWPNDISIGELGITCSSRLLWDKISKAQEDTFVILEDDAILAQDYSLSLDSVIKALPEKWDIIYLGMHPEYYKYFPKLSILNEFLERVSPDANIWGIYGYMVNKESAKRFLEESNIIDRPIDNVIEKLIKQDELIAYKAVLPMVKVKFNNSTIQEMGRKINVV